MYNSTPYSCSGCRSRNVGLALAWMALHPSCFFFIIISYMYLSFWNITNLIIVVISRPVVSTLHLLYLTFDVAYASFAKRVEFP